MASELLQDRASQGQSWALSEMGQPRTTLIMLWTNEKFIWRGGKMAKARNKSTHAVIALSFFIPFSSYIYCSLIIRGSNALLLSIISYFTSSSLINSLTLQSSLKPYTGASACPLRKATAGYAMTVQQLDDFGTGINLFCKREKQREKVITWPSCKATSRTTWSNKGHRDTSEPRG